MVSEKKSISLVEPSRSSSLYSSGISKSETRTSQMGSSFTNTNGGLKSSNIGSSTINNFNSIRPTSTYNYYATSSGLPSDKPFSQPSSSANTGSSWLYVSGSANYAGIMSSRTVDSSLIQPTYSMNSYATAGLPSSSVASMNGPSDSQNLLNPTVPSSMYVAKSTPYYTRPESSMWNSMPGNPMSSGAPNYNSILPTASKNYYATSGQPSASWYSAPPSAMDSMKSVASQSYWQQQSMPSMYSGQTTNIGTEIPKSSGYYSTANYNSIRPTSTYNYYATSGQPSASWYSAPPSAMDSMKSVASQSYLSSMYSGQTKPYTSFSTNMGTGIPMSSGYYSTANYNSIRPTSTYKLLCYIGTAIGKLVFCAAFGNGLDEICCEPKLFAATVFNVFWHSNEQWLLLQFYPTNKHL